MCDFTLTFSTGDSGYLVRAECPFSDASIISKVVCADLSDPRSLTKHLDSLEVSDIDSARRFGYALYQCVFQDDLAKEFQRALALATRDSVSLRLLLNLRETPELERVPWELLHDGHHFVAVDPAASVVRYAGQPHHMAEALAIGPKLRVLFTTACPKDLPLVDWAAKERNIRKALEALRSAVSLTVEHHVSLSNLRHLLTRSQVLERPFHIWHHYGHSGILRQRDTVFFRLAFEDRETAEWIDVLEVSKLLEENPSLRAAILNTCHDELSAEFGPALASLNVPAVVGFRDVAPESTVLSFWKDFYTAILRSPIEVGLSRARRALMVKNKQSVDWASPMLFLNTTSAILKGVALPPPLPPPKRPCTVLRLQLQHRNGMMEVRGLSVPDGGEPRTRVRLPFSRDELKAILKTLDAGTLPDRPKPEYLRTLNSVGLLHGDRLRTDFHKLVGRKLFEALFSEDFLLCLKESQRRKLPIACQLWFDPEDVILAQFPWELIHDGKTHLVAARQGLELTRYIMFDTPPPQLRVDLPLRLLFVSPRPEGEVNTLTSELEAVVTGLTPLRERGLLSWQRLVPPTWHALETKLNRELFHIIHFDGHGTFARVCPIPACGNAHYPDTEVCHSCGADMRDAVPQGYLSFENDEHRADLVPVSDLKPILMNSSTHLIVLTACGSGTVEGDSVFNSVAPGLIQAGIPAVVGMQGSPPVETMARFVERMYAMLAEGKRLPEAVNSGRLAIYRDEPVSWFMPVVYLRSSDSTHGQLFVL